MPRTVHKERDVLAVYFKTTRSPFPVAVFFSFFFFFGVQLSQAESHSNNP